MHRHQHFRNVHDVQRPPFHHEDFLTQQHVPVAKEASSYLPGSVPGVSAAGSCSGCSKIALSRRQPRTRRRAPQHPSVRQRATCFIDALRRPGRIRLNPGSRRARLYDWSAYGSTTGRRSGVQPSRLQPSSHSPGGTRLDSTRRPLGRLGVFVRGSGEHRRDPSASTCHDTGARK